jgi:hypothetical protein
MPPAWGLDYSGEQAKLTKSLWQIVDIMLKDPASEIKKPVKTPRYYEKIEVG